MNKLSLGSVKFSNCLGGFVQEVKLFFGSLIRLLMQHSVIILEV
jgi:hypothetical protein